MLSSTIAGSCKQSRRCHCTIRNSNLVVKLRLELQPKRHFTVAAANNTLLRPWHTRATWSSRSIATETESAISKSKNTTDNKNYDTILSAALDQSKVSVAQSMLENTFMLLRKGNPELAWECYVDLTCRDIQKYISRDQYKQLIKLFNHTKTNREQGLEYVLTLIEDMKQLGYQVGRKEKLLVMRLLGTNGNLRAMEAVFEDLGREQLLMMTDTAAAQKPFNIMLTCYQEHVETLGTQVLAEKSMDVYGEMLDRNIQPSSGTTRLLLENIRMADTSDEMVEKVWSWVWTKIGMNVGGKTKELDHTLYKEMVMYFASVGRPEYALEINDIMTKKKIPRTVRMLTALMHKVGRSGNIDRSMDLLNEMMIVDGLMPTIVTFNALIDVCAHKKPKADIAGANRIFDMLDKVGIQPDIVTFGTIIDMYAKLGDIDNVRKCYHDMVHTYHIEPNPHIYSSLIECCAMFDDRESTMQILDLLKKQGHRCGRSIRESCNLAFKSLVQGGHIQESIGLLDMMCSDKMTLEPRTFSPLLSYFAKQGDVKNAHKVASMMNQAGVKPNSHTYSILLEAFVKAGDINGAENIFNFYKQHFRPNTFVYNALLYVYTKKNEMDKVFDTYKRMSKAYVPANEYTYGILMYFYSKRKEVRAVEALISTMQSNNITPGCICRTILMQTYFECGKLQEAKETMERMIENGIEPTDVSWGILIKGSIESGQVDFAESVLTKTLDKYKQAKQPSQLLKDTALKSDKAYVQHIPKTLEDILAKERKPSQKKLSPYLFTPIIEAHSNAGNFTQAKQLFKTMIENGVPISIPAYTTLMSVFKKEKNYGAVERLWEAIYKPTGGSTVQDVDPILPSIPVSKQAYDYTNLLVLDEQDTGESRKPMARQVSPFALSIYIDSLVEQGRNDEVESLWSQLTQEGYSFDEQNWNRYIVSLIKNDRLDKACTIVSDQFLVKTEDVLPSSKITRKRDDIFISSDDQLHTRTCASFADAFQIAGAENMGELRLKSTVTEKIKDYLYKGSKKTIEQKSMV